MSVGAVSSPGVAAAPHVATQRKVDGSAWEGAGGRSASAGGDDTVKLAAPARAKAAASKQRSARGKIILECMTTS